MQCPNTVVGARCLLLPRVPPRRRGLPVLHAARGGGEMSILEIIREYLEVYGFDGLFNPGLCGCTVDDLSPGNCLSEQCEAGYKQPGCDDHCGLGCEFHIGAQKPIPPALAPGTPTPER